MAFANNSEAFQAQNKKKKEGQSNKKGGGVTEVKYPGTYNYPLHVAPIEAISPILYPTDPVLVHPRPVLTPAVDDVYMALLPL